MAEARANRDFDGVLTLGAGIDSSRSPYLINAQCAAFAVNVTFRGDQPKTRPAWMRRATLNTIPLGYFQGASFYRADNGVNQIVLSVGGRVYGITPGLNYQVRDLTIPGDRNSAILNFAYFVQAENYLVLNDGQSAPFIYDGVNSRRAGAGEITTGTVAAYANGRIWYATAKGTAFRAGDLVRSSSGSQVYGYRDAVLKLTENTLLNGGGDFSIPNSSGTIKAMGIPANLDTSLGQGPLQIFTDNGSFSVNAPTDRTQWQNLTDPVQTVSGLGGGAVGHRALTLVNGDIFFRANDGIRTFYQARRDYSQTWANTPISDEMTRVMETDNVYQLSAESCVLFGNRMFCTVWGQNSAYGIYHKGVTSMDFDPVSSLRDKQDPRWEGVWTGLNILQLVVGQFNGISRLFAIVLANSYGTQFELWELDEKQIHDNGTTRISCAYESPGLFRASLFNLKRVETARIFASNITGTVEFSMSYRPDNYSLWLPWHTWSVCANGDQCEVNECMTGNAVQLQYRPRMALPTPAEVCNESTGEPAPKFYQMQYLVEWVGPCTMNQVRIDAKQEVDPPFGDCPTEGVCRTFSGCSLLPALQYQI